ncbi:LuxR C-terminal-related transcriptional regulator [Streptomyces sp. URMC 124]|uniref:LuxR C-terminal-related transcriptional regulator n=1 Tax=Streptomyces sp. URMC 124 TaxID=3423405 RepID=UPI003F1A4A43
MLRLVVRGFDNRRIARELTLPDKIVRNYVSAALGKLGVGSRGEAIVAALFTGLTAPATGARPGRRSPPARGDSRKASGCSTLDRGGPPCSPELSEAERPGRAPARGRVR